MVYLIDDKKSRQESDYLWTNERFDQFKNIIKCIYTLEDLENESKEIFSNDNIILYHESFIDQTNKSKESIDKRNKLYAWSENRGNIVVYFSGSKNTRELKENIANIPVSTLYANLEIFLKKISINDTKVEYLIFGENINIERDLKFKQEISLKETFKEDPAQLNNKILFLCPSRDYISNPFSQFERKELFSDVSDEKLTEKISEWLNEIKYDQIFLPLCFGNVLSDYNGLRLATHIRCTSSLNQLTCIYIYGFVGMELLIQNEYFNILKTKNIYLIPFSKNAFSMIENILSTPFKIEELPEQIAKLKLDVPKNYEDNHSIVNEWAIYRWAKSIEANDNEISRITKNISNSLYFKYLSTIYPTSEIPKLDKNKLKLKYSSQPKILIVDDDAEKGWYEIFCKILSDINNIEHIDYIGEDFKSLSQDQIIKKTIEKIKVDNIDIVILDFRLHSDDFINKNINEFTGLILLNLIKELNPGIQVIILSATNKIWNLLAIQESNADGFVIKESPENSIDSSFTAIILFELIKNLQNCIDRLFLKKIFTNLQKIYFNLLDLEIIPENQKFNSFLKKIIKQQKIIYKGAENIKLDRPITLDIVFLSCYTFIDLFKKYYLIQGKDYRYYLGHKMEELKRYNISNNIVENQGVFIPNVSSDSPGIFHVYSALLKDYYPANPYDSNTAIKNLHKIKEIRNQYIHGSLNEINKEHLINIVDSLIPLTHNIIE